MKYKVTLNNRIYEVVVEKGEAILEKEYEAVAPQAQAPAVASQSVQAAPQAPAVAPQVASGDGEIFPSPMQGTIVAIKCEVGKSYKEGEVLFIVESMKMESEITISRNATVTAINVTKGQSIQSGTALCVIK